MAVTTWLIGSKETETEDMEFLLSLGIEIVNTGDFDESSNQYIVDNLSDIILDQLEPYWDSRFFWGACV